jgi:hypothetical protein
MNQSEQMTVELSADQIAACLGLGVEPELMARALARRHCGGGAAATSAATPQQRDGGDLRPDELAAVLSCVPPSVRSQKGLDVGTFLSACLYRSRWKISWAALPSRFGDKPHMTAQRCRRWWEASLFEELVCALEGAPISDARKTEFRALAASGQEYRERLTGGREARVRAARSGQCGNE